MNEEQGYSSTWNELFAEFGDDTPCPNCSEEQLETQDDFTECMACGWSKNWREEEKQDETA